MKRFGTSEQQLHVEVYPQEKLHPQFRKSTVSSIYSIAAIHLEPVSREVKVREDSSDDLQNKTTCKHRLSDRSENFYHS